MNTPLIIAGPCSVESRAHLYETVSQLHTLPQVHMIRCGIWKPRTRPNAFEGLGEPVLNWIDELKEQHPTLRFCCEVAQPHHVELCLQHNIDAVWIGARTTGNPFSVSELAQALRGSNISVMVKNPIAADINLWQGAIERIMQADIHHLAAIHRGFYPYRDSSPYRNKPLWEIPIELKRRMPSLPILCDPSHMGGHRRYLNELIAIAYDLGYDGYMIEVHPQPQTALTDSAQQIDIDTLRKLLAQLQSLYQPSNLSNPSNSLNPLNPLNSLNPLNPSNSLNPLNPLNPSDSSNLLLKRDLENLETLRQQIDAIDERILRTLGHRMEISRKIAQLKKANHLKTFQPQRWNHLLQQRTAAAQALGLDSNFIRTLYQTIHAESIRTQQEIIDK